MKFRVFFFLWMFLMTACTANKNAASIYEQSKYSTDSSTNTDYGSVVAASPKGEEMDPWETARQIGLEGKKAEDFVDILSSTSSVLMILKEEFGHDARFYSEKIKEYKAQREADIKALMTSRQYKKYLDILKAHKTRQIRKSKK